jgi:hypothetical protein
MAIDQGTETATRIKQRRTWRINIECAYGTVPSVQAYRELVKINPDKTLDSNESAGAVTRLFTDAIANKDQVTLKSGKVISVADLAEAIPDLIDMWDQADINAEAARLAAEQARMAGDAPSLTAQPENAK